jgi:hypothetical protein
MLRESTETLVAARRTQRGQPIDSTRNRRPNDIVQVCRVRRDYRERNYSGNSPKDSQAHEGRRSFFRGQGRRDDGADPQLSASAPDFVPYSDLRRNDNRAQHSTQDGVRTGNLNI